MPPPSVRNGPPDTTPAGRSGNQVGPTPTSITTVSVADLAARRELRAWLRAAEHFNRHGCAAAAVFVAPLRRRGLDVWAASTGSAA